MWQTTGNAKFQQNANTKQKGKRDSKEQKPQKKRGLENQDLGQPKSKIVNKPVNTEEATDEDSDQQEEIQTMTQNAMLVQKEEIESNPPNQSQNEDEETNENQINDHQKFLRKEQ